MLAWGAVVALTACTQTPVPSPESAATSEEVTGDVGVHDPGWVVGRDGQPWYVFSTGDLREGLGAIQVRTSPDGHAWTYAGTAWTVADEPAWTHDRVPGVQNYWAPEVVHHQGTWYLYYAASTFGSNTSAIGLRTTTAPDPFDPAARWVDRGVVVSSDGSDDFNVIDPSVVVTPEGQAWMAFGSFWGGIQLIPLEWPSGLPKRGAKLVTIANRGTATNAIEAPALVHRDGWFYLFASFDSCCRGTESTYNINVGRSRTVTGPYLDQQGRDLADGGGTLLLETAGRMIGPGGQSVSDGHLAFHYYDGDNGGSPTLAIRKLGWTADGWPVLKTTEELSGS